MGYLRASFYWGGGGGVNFLQISAPKGPIAVKFCMEVKTHVKSIATNFLGRKILAESFVEAL